MANAYALSGSSLIAFNTSNPNVGSTIAISGLNVGETLVGIDFRAQNGLLYGLGVNAAADTATLYVINPQTGVTTAVGTPGSVSFTTNGSTSVDLPDPATVGYGFDFNPAADRVRVTAGALNFRVNASTGNPVDGDNGGAPGSVLGTNPDGPTNGGTTSVDASAYTNNQPNNGNVTTLYTLDAASNSLFIQNPPNAGTQVLGLTVTLGGNPLDFTAVDGFDIVAGVNAAASNLPVTTGSGLALLTVGGVTGLYAINLVNGQAISLGNLLDGTTPASGLAIRNDLGGLPAIALSGDGLSLVRFNTATPGTTTTQALGPIVAGETLVAIDFRPQTGQLYGLGVNATANTATLYLIDPQSGAVQIVGVQSLIGFVDAAGNPVDFPDPAISGYGMDFNPAVDRIRITTDSGLNFRINPNTGAPVDGDLGGAPGSVSGINPDGVIHGGTTGVSAAAYTNSYNQSFAVTGPTTLYTLDPVGNQLFIQNPPNSGTETLGITVTLGGNPLDFTRVNGFDIPPAVSVGTSNAPAAGFGYAALTVGGVTGIYQIDLVTGEATDLGTIGAGATGMSGLALGNAPAAPVITSNGAGSSATLSVAENGTAVTTVAAFDADADVLSYSIIGGPDQGKFSINSATGALAFLAAPDFEAPTDADANNSYIVQVLVSDGGRVDTQTLTVNVTDVNEIVTVTGTPGPDSFTALPGDERIDALGGVDTVTFGFKLTDATVSYVGNTIVIDGPSSHTILTGVERFVFTDGTVDNADGSTLIDDLFYYSKYHDVWNAHVDADAHYNASGWHEGRDPSAFFSTATYLSAYPDVSAAGVNPLTHFHNNGWIEGRIPSIRFDPQQYQSAYPDIAAAQVDPLQHFLETGAGEGRQPFAPSELVTANGFDYVYYLNHNPDVAAAGVDPLAHFLTVGWTEGRNPNALFDTLGYLATYTDVQAANVNPLVHYDLFGRFEGRDPSVGFDTTSYLSANPDVAAAGVNPLAHFLQFGVHEGRSPFADGVWG